MAKNKWVIGAIGVKKTTYRGLLEGLLEGPPCNIAGAGCLDTPTPCPCPCNPIPVESLKRGKTDEEFTKLLFFQLVGDSSMKFP